MKVKVCFNNEIHRLSKVPAIYEELVQLISKNFHAKLPKNWVLEYIAFNGDKVAINSEKAFQEFKNQEAQSNIPVVKLYIVSVEELKQSQQNNVEEKEKNVFGREDEDYQIIQKEESKMEENLEIQKDENPKDIKIQEIEENKEDTLIEKSLEEVKQMTMPEQTLENMNGKVLIDLNELEKLVQTIIDSKIAQITESIKAQMIASVENSLHIQQQEGEKEKEKESSRIEEEEEKIEEDYYNSLMEKAKKLQKRFPKEDFDMLCVYVNSAPEDMSLEELVENFKH